MTWFSSLVVFSIFVDEGNTRISKSLIMLRSSDYESALKEALSRGYLMERSYLNEDGKLVEWRLNKIETLDQIGETIDDGREVYSEFSEIKPKDAITFDSKLDPESSEPTQTGV